MAAKGTRSDHSSAPRRTAAMAARRPTARTLADTPHARSRIIKSQKREKMGKETDKNSQK